MAQDDRVVVGIDVAKDKVDACIRSLSQEQTFLSTAAGQRALIRWLRKHKVGKVAMEASKREIGKSRLTVALLEQLAPNHTYACVASARRSILTACYPVIGEMLRAARFAPMTASK